MSTGHTLFKDWTVDPETHRTNSSPRFEELVEAVGRLLDDEVYSLAQGREGRRRTAGLIMAQLAHVHGLVPSWGLNKQ